MPEKYYQNKVYPLQDKVLRGIQDLNVDFYLTGGTITLENMRYRQFTRNPMIASFLAGYGYMERRGKGILRMLKLCEQNDIKCELSLTPDNNEFVVTYSLAQN